MSVSELGRQIARASRVTVLTGAGVSAASGVPTFRGAGGLWRQYRAEDLATPEAFHRNPRLVWEWYDSRRALVAGCQPNEAHRVLAEWSIHRGCTVITQNVDDLHLRAGTSGLIRLHGSLWELRCTGRDQPSTSGRSTQAAWVGPSTLAESPVDSPTRAHRRSTHRCEGRWRDERVPLAFPPTCPVCGALARPGVVWFGESLDEHDVTAATRAAACDVFVTVGTSALVYPAAGLIQAARGAGALTAEINTEPTPASDVVDIALTGPAELLLPQLNLFATN
jgi:NAD-dependent SIR2 family protein deacetylase